jgi:hypothetical protein
MELSVNRFNETTPLPLRRSLTATLWFFVVLVTSLWPIVERLFLHRVR